MSLIDYAVHFQNYTILDTLTIKYLKQNSKYSRVGRKWEVGSGWEVKTLNNNNNKN
jgi:hypothetical protein